MERTPRPMSLAAALDLREHLAGRRRFLSTVTLRSDLPLARPTARRSRINATRSILSPPELADTGWRTWLPLLVLVMCCSAPRTSHMASRISRTIFPSGCCSMAHRSSSDRAQRLTTQAMNDACGFAVTIAAGPHPWRNCFPSVRNNHERARKPRGSGSKRYGARNGRAVQTSCARRTLRRGAARPDHTVAFGT